MVTTSGSFLPSTVIEYHLLASISMSLYFLGTILFSYYVTIILVTYPVSFFSKITLFISLLLLLTMFIHCGFKFWPIPICIGNTVLAFEAPDTMLTLKYQG